MHKCILAALVLGLNIQMTRGIAMLETTRINLNLLESCLNPVVRWSDLASSQHDIPVSPNGQSECLFPVLDAQSIPSLYNFRGWDLQARWPLPVHNCPMKVEGGVASFPGQGRALCAFPCLYVAGEAQEGSTRKLWPKFNNRVCFAWLAPSR